MNLHPRPTIAAIGILLAAIMLAGAGCGNSTQTNATPSQTGGNATRSITSAEVAAHNTQSDCWMIIDGKVYDLTSFISMHPGGPAMISQYCGKDGSTGYATKDKPNPQPHSARADALLPQFLIGNLAN